MDPLGIPEFSNDLSCHRRTTENPPQLLIRHKDTPVRSYSHLSLHPPCSLSPTDPRGTEKMDPQAPSQPNLDTVYDQPSNPAQSTSEHAASTSKSASLQRSDPAAEHRKQGDVSSGEQNAMPSAMGYGARDASGDAGDSVGRAVSDLEGEQMRAPGEGDIASAQDKKHGFGEQGDMASDLDRKKDEQAKIKEARGGVQGGAGVDVGAAIGGGDKGFVGVNSENTNSAGRGTGMQSNHAEV